MRLTSTAFVKKKDAESIYYAQFIESHRSHVIEIGEVSIHVAGDAWPSFCRAMQEAMKAGDDAVEAVNDRQAVSNG